MNLFKKLFIKSKDIFVLDMKPITILSLIFLLIVYPLTKLFNEFVQWFGEHPALNTIKMWMEGIQPAITTEMIQFFLIIFVTLFVGFLILTLIQYYFTAAFLAIIHRSEVNPLLIIKKLFKKIPQILGFILLEMFMTAFGLLLFIIPGIFVYFVFYFAFTIMIVENKGIFQSVAKAFVFFKSQIWKILPTIIILKIIMLLASPITQWFGLEGIAFAANLFLSATFSYFILYSLDKKELKNIEI